MVQKISASVGRKGKNNSADVKVIQGLLNPFASKVGFSKLKIDGAPTPKLEKAIGQFQLQICGFKADYRVDPGKNTIKKLNAGPAKMAAEKKAEEKKVQKLKDDQKAKMIKAAKDAAMKEAKAKSLDKSAWDQLWSDVESYANNMWDSYVATAEKKGDPPEKAAPKIADMVTKEAKKKATVDAIKVAQDSAPTYPGRVTGKTTGVNKKIMAVLFEVSSFYEGTTIHVVSGLRNQKGQASAMFNGWNSHLKKGKIYVYLRGNEKLRLELDEFVTSKDKPGFIKHMLKNADFSKISRHLTGNAVDVTTRTEQKIIDALATCLRYLAEKNSEGIKCHHFDNRMVKMPTDAMKAKWKK
jgi:hypothetical protein